MRLSSFLCFVCSRAQRLLCLHEAKGNRHLHCPEQNPLKVPNFKNNISGAKTADIQQNNTNFQLIWCVWMQYVSLGRAFGSHPRGRGFESLWVHHFEKNHRQFGGDFSFDHNYTTDGRKS